MVGPLILYSYLETECNIPEQAGQRGKYIREHAFRNNGLGSLSEAISCTVTQERNGAYELEMEYPVSGLRYNDIKLRNIIFCKPNHYDNPQAFRIYSISKPISGAITIKASHISYDLSGWTCEPFAADNPAQFFNLLKNKIEPSTHATEFGSSLCPFIFEYQNFTNPQRYTDNVGTYKVGDLCIHKYTDTSGEEHPDTTWRCVHDISTPEEWTENHWQLAYHEYDVPASVKANIGANKNSFLSRFGGDVWYDNFTVHFQNTPEVDRHVVIRYGRNMTDFGIEETCTSQYSAVLPYWKATSNSQTITRLLKPDVYLGSVVRVVPGDDPIDFSRVIAVDLSSEFTDEPDDIKMIGFCNEYIRNNNLDKPVTSVKVSFVRLSDTEEYKNFAALEDTRLMDKVTVVHTDLNVTVTLYVSEMVYDVISGKYESITLGEKPKTVIDTIANTAQAVTPKGFSMTDMARTALVSLGVPEAFADKVIDVTGKVIDFGKDTWAALGFSVNPLNPDERLESKKETQTVYYLQVETTGVPTDPRDPSDTRKARWVEFEEGEEIDIIDEWTIIEPTEHSGGTYYTCEQTKSITEVDGQKVIAVANAGVKKSTTASSVANIVSGSGATAKATNLDVNTVNSNQIVTNAVTQSKLAADAIHSNEYEGPVGDEIYSRNGSFLNLANGNFITPSLRLYGAPVLGEPALYLKGAIEAEEDSKIGELLIENDSKHSTTDPGTRLHFTQDASATTGAFAETIIGRYDFIYQNTIPGISGGTSTFYIDTEDKSDFGGGEITIGFETYKALSAEESAAVSKGLINNSGIDFETYTENASSIAEFKMDDEGGHLIGNWEIDYIPTPTSSDDGKFLKVVNGAYVLGEGGGSGSDSWRPIKVNGDTFLGSGTSTGPLEFIGYGVNITPTLGKLIFSINSSELGVMSVATGDSNGQIKVTPSTGAAYNVNVKGLGSAAYTNANAYAPTVHYHDAGSVEIDNTTIVGDDDGVIGFSTTWGDNRYALKTHNHTGVYSPVGHTHPLSDIMFGSSKIDGGNINHDSSLDDTDGILSLSTNWLNTRYSQTGHTHTKSQITDFPTSMPASDVYSWAKASTKPSYTYSEVGAAPLSHDHAASEIIHDNTLAADENDELGVNTTWADGRYSLTSHNHTGVYSPVGHTHTGVYAPSQHAHQGSDIDHDSTLVTTSDGELSVSTTWLNNNYAQKTHTHTKSQITDFPTSMPASDVYSWAKASTKPSYTYSEVGAPSTTGANASGTWGINITGNAVTLGGYPVDKYLMFGTLIDASALDQNKWYPVGVTIPASKYSRVELENALNSNTPSWASHSSGFSYRVVWETNGSGWGTIGVVRNVHVCTYSFCPADTVGGLTQNTNASTELIYVRGGGIYYFKTSVGTERPVLYSNGYHWESGEYSYDAPVRSEAPSPIVCKFQQVRVDWENLDNVPSVFTPASHRHSITDINFGSTKLDAGVLNYDSTLLNTDGALGVSTSWLNNNYAIKTHNHSGTYSPVGHTHTGVYAPAQHAHQGSEIDHDSTLVTTSDGELSVNSNKFFMDFGPNPTTGIGGGIVQPGGAAARSIRTTDGGSKDVGIFYLSQDNAYIANSSDNCYSFAVFDTDLTTDFSNPSNASFAVASNGGGCLIRGNTVIHSGNIGSQSVAYATSAGSAPQRTIKVNGSNYITDNTTPFDIVQGNHITIRKPSTGRIIIDYDSTCLLEGTLITMADGTQKPIEEIQNGDEIKSYDPTTGEIISAYALDLECTGSTNEYKYTIFDDGSEIVTYGNHSLYSSDLGYPKDIEKWQLGDKGVNIDGDVIEMLDQGIVRYKGTWKKHYVLYSSNNLYFANNILTCHWGSTKYKHLKDFDIFDKLPETVKDTFEEEEHKYGDKGQWMLSKEYVTELVNIRKRRNTLSKLIDDCKKKLNETDYVGQKYLEGLITAVEWLKHKTDRAGWRKLINDNETELASLESQITTLKRKYKTPLTQRKRFAEYVTMCNSVFDDLTQYYKRG